MRYYIIIWLQASLVNISFHVNIAGTIDGIIKYFNGCRALVVFSHCSVGRCSGWTEKIGPIPPLAVTKKPIKYMFSCSSNVEANIIHDTVHRECVPSFHLGRKFNFELQVTILFGKNHSFCVNYFLMNTVHTVCFPVLSVKSCCLNWDTNSQILRTVHWSKDCMQHMV